MFEINIGIGIIALLSILLFPSISKAEDENKGEKWQDKAKADGFEFMPASDMRNLRDASNALKELRGAIPEEWRGKEKEFFSQASEAIKKVSEKTSEEEGAVGELKSELKTTRTNLTKLENNLSEVQKERDTLRAENRSLFIWGSIDKEISRRGVPVHPRLITDQSVESFPLDDYRVDNKLDTEEGERNFRDAIWKRIIEPAHKATLEIKGIEHKTTPSAEPSGNNSPANNAPPPNPLSTGWGKSA